MNSSLRSWSKAVLLFGLSLCCNGALAAPNSIEPTWRPPLVKAVVACGEPLPIDQYSNTVHRVTLFRVPRGTVIFCAEDLGLGTHRKLVGKMMHRATGRIAGEYEFFRATDGNSRYSLISIEREDDDSDESRPTFILEVAESSRILYRGEVRVAYPFDFWLFGKH